MSETEVVESTALAVAQPQSIEGLIALAIEHEAAVEPLERLLAMRRELKAEAAREAFFEALSAFQAECPVIGKSRTARVESRAGGSYTYQYAPLEEILQAVTPVLHRYGLSVRFNTRFESQPDAQVVTCIVHHVQGHSEESEFRAPVDSGARMNVMQQAASAQTYGKRYALLNALGITVGGEDNDGHGASGRTGERAVPDYAAARPSGVVRDTAAPSSSPSGRAGGSATAPQPRARGNLVRLVREAQGSDGSSSGPGMTATALVEPVAATPASPQPAADDPLAERRQELVEKAMNVELAERRSRGQELPPEMVLLTIAQDRCDGRLDWLYGKRLDTATRSELDALERIIDHALQKLEQTA